MASRGELEQRVLELLWDSGEPMTVAAVHRCLQDERELAYTTVMTVLDRLAKKHLVTRALVGRAWEYQPRLTQDELVSNELIELLNSCPPAVQVGVLSRFVQALSQDQRQVLGT